MGTLVRERFNWVEDLRQGLVFLIDDAIDSYFQVKQMSDPLMALLTITLRRPLPKASRQPMREYIRAWASVGNCEVPRIHITDRGIYAELLFKYRHPRGKTKNETQKREEQ